MPDKPLFKVHEKSFVGMEVVPAGGEVEYDHGTVRGEHMQPINRAAKEAAGPQRRFFGGFRAPDGSRASDEPIKGVKITYRGAEQ